MISWNLNIFFKKINTVSLLSGAGVLCSTSYYLISGIIVISALQSLSWVSLFALCWFCGIIGVTGSQHLTVQGTLVLLVSALSAFLVKTLFLWFGALDQQVVTLYQLGDYAPITDNYLLQLSILLDAYSLSYIALTTTIGVWAVIFASNYMRGEPRILNFIYLLFFFLISMVLLLASGNLPTLMLGWELIGCFSFLLINFWTTRVGTAKSAFKAFFFNKLSDASLILVLILFIIFLPNSFNLGFSNLFVLEGLSSTVLGLSCSIMDITVLCLIVCSFCKSAQFGLHVWLPDSMEAPVPASALIHSATLVSAGIFLLGRFDILLISSWASSLILIWSSFTALYGGVVAAYQTDLKRILAYSTISHCGFLFLLVIYNNFFALLLYLHLHGWFKSYSFMAAGNIISKYAGYQDYRRMGGSPYMTTVELVVLVVSIACLGGLPFLLGFFNKHYLLLLSSEYYIVVANLFILGAAFTGLFYTIKTVWSLLSVSFKGSQSTRANLVHGLTTRVGVSSEPVTNLILFLVYSLIISSLVVVVLSGDFFSASVLFHTTFGILFFIIYIVVALSYLQNFPLVYIMSLLVVKLIYVI